VNALGLHGDVQTLPAHGGADRARYACAREDADWWAAELDREIPPGLFGENLTTAGIDVNGALIGERWRVGARRANLRRRLCSGLQPKLDLTR
jgi:MOSC domain-containing protein YiiM